MEEPLLAESVLPAEAPAEQAEGRQRKALAACVGSLAAITVLALPAVMPSNLAPVKWRVFPFSSDRVSALQNWLDSDQHPSQSSSGGYFLRTYSLGEVDSANACTSFGVSWSSVDKGTRCMKKCADEGKACECSYMSTLACSSGDAVPESLAGIKHVVRDFSAASSSSSTGFSCSLESYGAAKEFFGSCRLACYCFSSTNVVSQASESAAVAEARREQGIKDARYSYDDLQRARYLDLTIGLLSVCALLGLIIYFNIASWRRWYAGCWLTRINVDSYDAVIPLRNIRQLMEGQPMEVRIMQGKERAMTMEMDNDRKIVALLGVFNTGKTFIINELTKKNLPSGPDVRTEGISLIASPNGGPVFLDAAGTGTPGTYDLCDCESSHEAGVTEQLIGDILRHMSSLFVYVVEDVTSADFHHVMAHLKGIAGSRQKRSSLVLVYNLRKYESAAAAYQCFLDIQQNKMKRRVLGCLQVPDASDGKKRNSWYGRKLSDKDFRFLTTHGEGDQKTCVHHFAILDHSSEWGRKINTSQFEHLSYCVNTADAVCANKKPLLDSFVESLEQCYPRYVLPATNIEAEVVPAMGTELEALHTQTLLSGIAIKALFVRHGRLPVRLRTSSYPDGNGRFRIIDEKIDPAICVRETELAGKKTYHLVVAVPGCKMHEPPDVCSPREAPPMNTVMVQESRRPHGGVKITIHKETLFDETNFTPVPGYPCQDRSGSLDILWPAATDNLDIALSLESWDVQDGMLTMVLSGYNAEEDCEDDFKMLDMNDIDNGLSSTSPEKTNNGAGARAALRSQDPRVRSRSPLKSLGGKDVQFCKSLL